MPGGLPQGAHKNQLRQPQRHRAPEEAFHLRRRRDEGGEAQVGPLSLGRHPQVEVRGLGRAASRRGHLVEGSRLARQLIQDRGQRQQGRQRLGHSEPAEGGFAHHLHVSGQQQ